MNIFLVEELCVLGFRKMFGSLNLVNLVNSVSGMCLATSGENKQKYTKTN